MTISRYLPATIRWDGPARFSISIAAEKPMRKIKTPSEKRKALRLALESKRIVRAPGAFHDETCGVIS